MILLFSYDIADARRRRRMAKLMECFGTRMQRSVFQCDVTENIYERIIWIMKDIIKPDEDSVLAYTLCENDVKKAKGYGLVPMPPDEVARSYTIL
jgi:CRISPR-associated protein Cas2